MSTPNTPTKKTIRCAIYTRKSTEEGLDQEFNTLDAQRDSAVAFVASHKHEGWVCLPERYDDGGFTGGNMDRPALKRLLADVAAGKIDTVLVYKLDRISRSLADFASIIALFDKHDVAFVSITQSFNTATSTGRLMMNILSSFSQYERELVSERTRDKIAATRRKGLYSARVAPLGYDFVPVPAPQTGKRLTPNPEEAERVRTVFSLYLEERSLLKVAAECAARGWTTKAGAVLDKQDLSKLLKNVLYIGKVPHGGQVYPGEHEAIVDADVFAKVQAQLKLAGQTGGAAVRTTVPALLRGLVRCRACQCAMTPTMATKKRPGGGEARYTYYVCASASNRGRSTCPCPSIPGASLEEFVVEQIKTIMNDDATLRAVVDRAVEILGEAAQARAAELAAVNAALARGGHARDVARLRRRQEALAAAVKRDRERLVDEDEVVGAVEAFDGVWGALTGAEREELVREVVERVEYDAAAEVVSLTFKNNVGLPVSEEVMA